MTNIQIGNLTLTTKRLTLGNIEQIADDGEAFSTASIGARMRMARRIVAAACGVDPATIAAEVAPVPTLFAAASTILTLSGFEPAEGEGKADPPPPAATT